MSNSTFENLAAKFGVLKKKGGPELESEVVARLEEVLDEHLDTIAGGHTSNHSDNHGSVPDPGDKYPH